MSIHFEKLFILINVVIYSLQHSGLESEHNARVIINYQPFPKILVCSQARRLSTSQTNRLSNPVQFHLTQAGDFPDGDMFPSYNPTCQKDHPELYTPRQCVQRDCFCVNVTSGLPFIETHYSSRELGDCKSVVFLIRMKIKRILAPFIEYVTEEVEDDYWVGRIKRRLKDICRSTRGHQVIRSVQRIPSNYATRHMDTDQSKVYNNSLLIDYEIILLSIGHDKVLTVRDLIQNQLEDGSFFDDDSLLPDGSSIRQLDPTPEWALNPTHEITSQITNLKADYSQKTNHSSTFDDNKDQNNTVSADHSKKFNRDILIQGMQQDYPAQSTKFVSSREAADNLALSSHLFRADIFTILSQPGVIAGIIGIAIAAILLLVLLILYCIYRLRKRDKGSYSLYEVKRRPDSTYYIKANSREFYA